MDEILVVSREKRTESARIGRVLCSSSEADNDMASSFEGSRIGPRHISTTSARSIPEQREVQKLVRCA